MLAPSRCLVLVVALGGCSKSEPASKPQPDTAKPAAASATKKAKDPARAKELIANGAPAVDVRTADEVAEGKLPNALHVPVDEVGTRIAEIDKLVGGDKSKPIVVYCASGARSAKAQQTLEAAGYTNVVNGGGYDDLAP